MIALKMIGMAYGILLLSGAYFGWKAGSKVSLIMGLASGAIALIGIYIFAQNESLAIRIFLVLSSLLSLTFAARYLKTKKIMPSGMLLVVSVIVLVVYLIAAMK